MSSSRGARWLLNAWWPVVLATAFVSVTSTAYFGADRSSALLMSIWKHFFPPLSHIHWYWLIVAIRKTCHFIGYGLIGLAWLRAWRLMFPRARFLFNAGLAVLGTALIASCDEYHQSLIRNRTGSPWDVLLDCCGALFMCLLVFPRIRRTTLMRESRAHEQLCATGEKSPT